MTRSDRAVVAPLPSSAPQPRVLFVGAFEMSNAAVRGGQLQACTTLLGSSFASQLDLVLLDTTQVSVPPPPIASRALRAAARVAAAMNVLLFSRIDALLVFCANGASFIEKGVVVCAARLLGKRVVLAPRSGHLLDDYRRSAVWRAVIRLVLRASSVVICQGRSWQEFFVRAGAGAEQCMVVKNWVSAPDLVALPVAKRHPGPLRVLYLGWLEPTKGVFELLTAIDEVNRGGRPVTAVFAGDGSARQKLQSEVVRLHLDAHVTLFGWASREQRCELMSQADVVVMPSYQEGLPNAVLEAMAAGRAVVATRVGAVPDVIRDGENGLLIEASDAAMLASRLRQLHDHGELIERLGAHARRTIIAEHDLERAAQTLVRALTGAPSRSDSAGCHA